MRHLLHSLGIHNKSQHQFEREIAPGVRVKIRRLPASFSMTGAAPLSGLTSRVHDAWDVLRGKAHASAKPSIQQRLRRAA